MVHMLEGWDACWMLKLGYASRGWSVYFGTGTIRSNDAFVLSTPGLVGFYCLRMFVLAFFWGKKFISYMFLLYILSEQTASPP
jgi:hypothetical protein